MFFGENNRFYKIIAILITALIISLITYALILEFGGSAAFSANLTEFVKCMVGVVVFSAVVYLIVYTIVYCLTFYFIRYDPKDFIYSVNKIKYADGTVKYYASVQREKFAKFELLSEDPKCVDDDGNKCTRYMLASDNLLVYLCEQLEYAYFDTANKAIAVANGYKQQIISELEKQRKQKDAEKVINETQIIIS